MRWVSGLHSCIDQLQLSDLVHKATLPLLTAVWCGMRGNRRRVNTRTHTYTPTPTHTRTHTPTDTHAHTHTHRHVRIHTCTHACTHMNALTRMHTHAHMHARTWTHSHACTHTHAHTHTCTHTHTHAHTHMHTVKQSVTLALSTAQRKQDTAKTHDANFEKRCIRPETTNDWQKGVQSQTRQKCPKQEQERRQKCKRCWRHILPHQLPQRSGWDQKDSAECPVPGKSQCWPVYRHTQGYTTHQLPVLTSLPAHTRVHNSSVTSADQSTGTHKGTQLISYQCWPVYQHTQGYTTHQLPVLTSLPVHTRVHNSSATSADQSNSTHKGTQLISYQCWPVYTQLISYQCWPVYTQLISYQCWPVYTQLISYQCWPVYTQLISYQCWPVYTQPNSYSTQRYTIHQLLVLLFKILVHFKHWQHLFFHFFVFTIMIFDLLKTRPS